MQTLSLLLTLSLLATPAAAQDEETACARGGLLSEGSRLILEGLADEMRPMMDEHVLPFIAELSELMDDVALYELPERLPNGDIIIRRRDPLEPEEDDSADPGAPIDL